MLFLLKLEQQQTILQKQTKLHAPVVTLSTQDDIKLLKQQESGFKRIINWS